VFNGEIVFSIADNKSLEVDFGAEIIPSKIVNKGDMVALGKKAPKNKWMYKIVYGNGKEYSDSLEKMVNQLCNKVEYVNDLARTYEDVSIMIYVRSDFAEIGYAIPSHILKKLALLDCSLNFSILSFGMTIDD